MSASDTLIEKTGESSMRYLHRTGNRIYYVRVKRDASKVMIEAQQYATISEYTSEQVIEYNKTQQGPIFSIISPANLKSIVRLIDRKFEDLTFADVSIKAFILSESVCLCFLRKTDRLEWPLGSVLPMTPTILRSICRAVAKDTL